MEDRYDNLIDYCTNAYGYQTYAFSLNNILDPVIPIMSNKYITEIYAPKCMMIQPSTFAYCAYLRKADFLNCTAVYSNAFIGCYDLSYINFPQLQMVGSYAFSGDYNLQSVNLPNCSIILGQAFRYCSGL